jgi:Dolichyl-phosphate-mannose-protein mannosyltransferase
VALASLLTGRIGPTFTDARDLSTRDRVRELRRAGRNRLATERSGPHPDQVRRPAGPGATSTAPRRLPNLSRAVELLPAAGLAAILLLAVFVRTWHLNSLGYNSDEAVYAGQGASIANFSPLEPYFPTFRAHPLLFQTLLSFGFRLGFEELFGRLLSAGFGVATIVLVFLVGRTMYDRRVGLVAALFMALMPYHVLVTRQVLLDGPMVFYATLSLYLIVRYSKTQERAWLLAAGACMGLTVLSKETSIVLLGSLYAFFAVTPAIRVRIRDIASSLAAMGVVMLAFPFALSLGGKPETGGHYLAYQIFRRPNHDWGFYVSVVPKAIGPLVLFAALAGLVLMRRRRSWRETLLMAWIAIPVAFFQLWPVKGFQYLLPTAPAVALLAAWAIVHGLGERGERGAIARRVRGPRLAGAAVVATVVSLLLPAVHQIQPRKSLTFLAGSGGVPGGREAGRWIERHIPEGARILAVGPSMANIVQYYGRRKAFGLAVSPNPLHRNPAYEPLPNPDLLIRHNDLQYLIWDAFSAARSPFFSQRILRYVDRFNGRLIHSETIEVETAAGKTAKKPLISIYEVRP